MIGTPQKAQRQPLKKIGTRKKAFQQVLKKVKQGTLKTALIPIFPTIIPLKNDRNP